MVFDEENVSTVCAEVIKKFGEGIVAHYNPEGQERGRIEG